MKLRTNVSSFIRKLTAIRFYKVQSEIVLEKLVNEISFITAANDKKNFLCNSLPRVNLIDESDIKSARLIRVLNDLKVVSALLLEPTVNNLMEIERKLSLIQANERKRYLARKPANVIDFPMFSSVR
ncbi:hypothetical protein [Aliikangiella coralliicola]|uniref:Uncharacterized protein n=1 Tax=Aliikangiella coralliicola TaxID=2592383 RepID=A0A545U040_9GAMM|nr:hypothetical protein [Aliikangiella coralliicola]TQV82832.1 hypothetical protein FLL46_23985 [Aliikangiella coralliicola]